MPTYETLEDIPDLQAVAAWKWLGELFKVQPELAWLQGRVLLHDVSTLKPEEAPILCIAKAADDWRRESIGRQASYDCWWDFGIRLYFYDKGLDTTLSQPDAVAARLALRLQLENANSLILACLRNDPFICQKPYWDQLELTQGSANSRTSIIGVEGAKLSITSRFRVMKRFRPGQ